MNTTFAKDVITGLMADQKNLPSKYFYDDNGSRIFQEIMKMPEYYLTDSEQIFEALKFSQPFNIIELGPGDGFKTFKFLEYLEANEVDFNYIPIDISSEAIDMLTQSLQKRLPKLKIQPKVGDYFEIFNSVKSSKIQNLLLFL